MKRVAIFAHYDKLNQIDEYVVEYLATLKKDVDDIIFVSDGKLLESEISKITHLVFDSICDRHGEYDFGSYKRGFQLLQNKYSDKLQEIDELLFVNDSCYCLGDFQSIFKEMEKTDCDAWSLGDDYDNFESKFYYLQSYFIVLRRGIFLEEFFKKFIESITKLESKAEIIIKYEIGLSKELAANNKKLFAYYGANKMSHYLCDNYLKIREELISLVLQNNRFSCDKALITINELFNVSKLNYANSDKFYLLLRSGFPLLKKSIIDSNIKTFDKERLTFFWKEIVSKYKPKFIKIIESHAIKTKTRLKSPKTLKILIALFSQKLEKSIPRIDLMQIKHRKDNSLVVKILKVPIFDSRFLYLCKLIK